MSKNSASFDPAAFASLNSMVEDVKARLNKNASNRGKAEDRLASLKEESASLEAELRSLTAELESMARKGFAALTKKGQVSADLVNILLRLPTGDDRTTDDQLSLPNQ